VRPAREARGDRGAELGGQGQRGAVGRRGRGDAGKCRALPSAVVDEVAAERLLADLEGARHAAETIAGRAPVGLRAVEPAAGRRSYLCAFDGPGFLCLDAALAPETAVRRAREVAVAGLLCEVAEEIVDAEALRGLAAAAGRLLAVEAEGDVAEALGGTAEAALALAAWREAPERALASLPELDAAGRRHERLREAYTAFVTATAPLVEAQDALSDEHVAALRAMEEAAGRAGLAEGLVPQLGAAVPSCDHGADEILSAHLTSLES
jgi:hypothetical protein